MNQVATKIDDPFVFEEAIPSVLPRLKTLTAVEFLSLDIPPRELILDPWLPEKGLVMLVAPRGVGKTLFSLSTAYAIAVGDTFLGFKAPTPRRTLYIDGEMPARTMQERISSVVNAFENEPPAPDYFRILAADLVENGLPDLSTKEGQEEIDAQVGNAELIVLDNLSTLVRGGKENDAESWAPMQDWVLRHRRAGRSVLLVHHSGKNGTPRGTSKREDVLDTIIALRRPQDYSSDQGARFEVHFEKARGFFGDGAQAFEASYETIGNKAVWTRKDIDCAAMSLVIEACNKGMSLRKIEEVYDIPKSTAARLKAKANRERLINAG